MSLGTKFPSPRGGVQGEPWLGSRGKPPKASDRLWKWCINYSSAGRFAVSTNAQKHYNISRGGQVPPLAHACWRPCSSLRSLSDKMIQTIRVFTGTPWMINSTGNSSGSMTSWPHCLHLDLKLTNKRPFWLSVHWRQVFHYYTVKMCWHRRRIACVNKAIS